MNDHRDGGLGFWLRYVGSSGGLAEAGTESALAVLPARLQQEFELPEEVTVTGDPDVAREEGATLLTAGHPALGRAAELVLDGGDAGVMALPSPASIPLQRETLLAKAREQFPVEHGRIDATGAPRPAMRPVLRVGALVSYTVSEEDHFQERAECWVDVTSRLELPAALSGRLARLEPTTTENSAQDYLVKGATAEAHRILDAGAATRQRALSAQATGAYERERERARAYYAEQLSSIERRRANATPDRQAMLDARTDATRTEQERRLTEIDERYRARHEIRPYRLHLVLVPAQRLPVDVRRGDRRYPLMLDWLAPAGTFADLRCPTCGEHAGLVAGKSALGCARCMGGQPTTVPTRSPATAPAPPKLNKTGTPGAASVPPTISDERSQRRRQAGPRVPEPTARGVQRTLSPARIRKMGEKLGQDWWEAAANRNRRISRMCAPDSPAAALIRLYRADGAGIGIGLAGDDQPLRVSSTMYPSVPEESKVTGGTVETRGARYHYLLRWRLDDATPLVEEVLPYRDRVDARLPSPRWLFTLAAARMFSGLPEPRCTLDPVAATLWGQALPRHGLPIALRCLAAWWRADDTEGLLEQHQPQVPAAAVDRMVCQRAGNRGARYADVALAYGGALLQRTLKLSAMRWW